MVSMQQEKITITIPTQIKEEVAKLKDDLKVSMNSIYQTAIQEYVKQKNREKLRAEALQMVDEYKNNPEMIELSNFEEDIVEY
jgi:metal-responsive CopG/Arc/MetJ family transcriptional regulator